VELARLVVPGIAHTQLDAAEIMAGRARVADEIIALDQRPLLLVETRPPAGDTLYYGPTTCEVRGLSEPDATVRVNGRTVAVADDGTFACRASPGGEPAEIRIEVHHDGKQKANGRSESPGIGREGVFLGI